MNCWYCNKELVEPTTTYKRTHRKKKYRTEITVHTSCYKSFNKTRKRFGLVVPGSITQ